MPNPLHPGAQGELASPHVPLDTHILSMDPSEAVLPLASLAAPVPCAPGVESTEWEFMFHLGLIPSYTKKLNCTGVSHVILPWQVPKAMG